MSRPLTFEELSRWLRRSIQDVGTAAEKGDLHALGYRQALLDVSNLVALIDVDSGKVRIP